MSQAISRDPECVFCRVLAGELPGTVVAEDERTVTLMDINPATRGHALVLTRAHVPDLLSLAPEDLGAVAHATQWLARRVTECLGADGVNVVSSNGAAAWQTVFHIHMHVIPRYRDDPLRLPWVPAPGDPEEIAKAAELLRA